MIVTLKYPVTVGERTVTHITFPDRVLLKHVMATDGHLVGSVASDNALLASLTGESELIIQNIDIEDAADLRVELARIWEVFFGLKKTYTAGGEQNPPNAANALPHPNAAS